MEEKVVCRKFRQTTQHGALEGKTQSKDVKYYNLDVIISVGYRVKKRFKGSCSVSFGHRIRLLRPPHSTPSATAAVSFG
nr:RhuM family protein [Segatella copri]